MWDLFLGLNNWQVRAEDWVNRNYQSVLRIVVILLLCWVISSLAEKTLAKILMRTVREDLYQTTKDREKRLKTLAGLGGGVTRFVVWVTGFVMIISILGVNTSPFLASAGVVGIAVGLGAQKLINDLVSGVFIISENQYRIGDFVELNGVSGTVQDISIRTTVLRDLSGAVHHVPNGSIVVSTNMSMGYGQINLDITVDDNTDISKLEKIINQVGKKIADDPKIKDEIIEAPKFIRVTDYTGTGVTVKVMGKTNTGKQLEIKSLFYTELKQELIKNKIRLAFVPFGMPGKKK